MVGPCARPAFPLPEIAGMRYIGMDGRLVRERNELAGSGQDLWMNRLGPRDQGWRWSDRYAAQPCSAAWSSSIKWIGKRRISAE